MKSLIKKVTTMVLFGLIVSASMNAKSGKTIVTLRLLDRKYVFLKDGVTFNVDGMDTPAGGEMAVNPFRTGNYLNKFSVSDGRSLLNINAKKYLDEGAFRGYAYWNWTIDKQGNSIRQALDVNKDGTPGDVLCTEVNGKVTSATSNHDSDTTCARQHS